MNNAERTAALKSVPLPAGAEFRISRVDNANHKPHPYMIGNEHMEKSQGTIDADLCRRVPCAMRGCNVSYDNHTSDVFCFIKVTRPGELKDVPNLQEFLVSLKAKAEEIGIDGFAFIDDSKPRTGPGRIKREGAGGFLSPPTHPEHTMSVSGPGFWMSLSSALEEDADWLNSAVQSEARRILKEWDENKPALSSPEVQDWVRQVLGYFRNCYKGEGPEPTCWNAGQLRIVKKGEDLPPIDEHAGVRHIRKYYPSFTPTEE